jgi:uncharacterized membrane protein YkoI
MRFAWILLVPLMMGVSVPAHAQRRADPPITMEAARRTAMERVPNSTVVRSKLEHENGKPVYEVDLREAGKSGIERVMVDGTTGRVTSIKHESAKTMKGAAPRITMAAARRAAMERVPHSTVIKEELEHKNGKPVYEFDLRVPGKAGYEEVMVDGTTGAVLSVKHETARGAKKEMKKQHKQTTKQMKRPASY